MSIFSPIAIDPLRFVLYAAVIGSSAYSLFVGLSSSGGVITVTGTWGLLERISGSNASLLA